MALNFNSLFGIFGKLGYVLSNDINSYQNNIATDFANLVALYSSTEETAYDGFQNNLVSAQTSVNGWGGNLQTLAANILNLRVYNDNPLLQKNNTAVSLAEMLKQMKSQNQTVKKCTVSASVSSSGNNGNGVCVATTKRYDGLDQENLFAENIYATCSLDSSSSSNLAGSEQFTITGQLSSVNALGQDFPLGSGASATTTAINATKDNLIKNTDFEKFTNGLPTSWTVVTGNSSTITSSANFYTGASSLNFIGNGSELTGIKQAFSAKSENIYAVNIFAKVDVVPGAGVLTLSLVDGNGTTINNQQGAANTFNISLPTLTTSWQAFNVFFFTPYILPSSVSLQMGLTTALDNGKNLYLDTLGFGAVNQLYTGGPALAIFSGNINFYVPDSFKIVTANNRGGASNNKTFQTVLDRLFSLRDSDILLSSSASPTLSDALIS